MSLTDRLLNKLADREASNTKRKLRKHEGLADFSSNDYLGLGKSIVLIDPIRSGSGGSRLLNGNYHAIEQLEQRIARITEMESALIYSSGYAANLGLLSTLPQRGDVVLYDELVHASIRDGIRLSHANAYSFGHNNWNDLEEKLNKWKYRNEVFVVFESVYSMDGDSPDLQVFKNLYNKYRFNVFIDEAHSFGLSKSDPFQQELSEISTARIITFGKAMGADGAAVLCSEVVRDYLINFSKSFIYSTAPSPHKIALINAQFDTWEQLSEINEVAQKLKTSFYNQLKGSFELITGLYGNIIGLVIGDVNKVKLYADRLHHGGFDVRPILSPTVAEGRERLRFCFHDFNTQQEVDGMVSLLLKIQKEVG